MLYQRELADRLSRKVANRSIADLSVHREQDARVLSDSLKRTALAWAQSVNTTRYAATVWDHDAIAGLIIETRLVMAASEQKILAEEEGGSNG